MYLRELRKEKHLTQCQLAKKVKVDQTAISQWERGITKPSLNNLLLLSEILDCDIDKLIKNISKGAKHYEKDRNAKS